MLAFYRYFSFVVVSLFFASACVKAKYPAPTCDSDCITVQARFLDRDKDQPLANKKLKVSASWSSGAGLSTRKLWNMSTDENGEAHFDVSFNDLEGTPNPDKRRISFFIKSLRYTDGSGSSNRVDMRVSRSDIGKVVSKEFILYKN